MPGDEDLMEARSAAAISLRNFDAHARSSGVKLMRGKIKDERMLLAANLAMLGGTVWPYSPSKDNSWVVGGW